MLNIITILVSQGIAPVRPPMKDSLRTKAFDIGPFDGSLDAAFAREGVLRPEGLPVQNRDAQTVSSYYFSFACQLLAFDNALSIPKSNRDNELSEARKRRKVLRLVPSCSPRQQAWLGRAEVQYPQL
jgi:hypothetical protein